MTIGNEYHNTMYYTTPQGTINTITVGSTQSIDAASWTNPNTYNNTPSLDTYWAQINDWKMREFEHVMPDLTKVEEMCRMYPAMDKAFENFKAIYNLIKDDYEAKKNNGF